ncbi:hypothetical protein V6R21_18825 [Limibacter armeniacum]|uniref:hypothetical protein n=1 Tax=Limibacter armeniacum TaxID=466084 RepID=UPI002FE621F7
MKKLLLLIFISMMFHQTTIAQQVLKGSMSGSARNTLVKEATDIIDDWRNKTGHNTTMLNDKLNKANSKLKYLEADRISFLTDDEQLLSYMKEKGRLSLLLGEYDEAIGSLRQCLVLEASPGLAAKYAQMLGVACVAASQHERACQYFELASELSGGKNDHFDRDVHQLWKSCCGL